MDRLAIDFSANFKSRGVLQRCSSGHNFDSTQVTATYVMLKIRVHKCCFKIYYDSNDATYGYKVTGYYQGWGVAFGMWYYK